MEIKDLILPEYYSIEQELKELDKKYYNIFLDNTSPTIKDGLLRQNDYARNYLKELDKIEKKKLIYNQDFWIKVQELNKEKLAEINCFINFALNGVELYFKHLDQRNYTPHFKFHEIELINEQYRLLQKIYYSRLEAENE